MEIVPVILCGGSGTRLWPLSRAEMPKQFLRLTGEYSLLQNTLLRALSISGALPSNVVTVTLKLQMPLVAEHLAAIDPKAGKHILGEPRARNTAAAIALAADYVAKKFSQDAIMWVLSSDAHIGDEENLRTALQSALEVAAAGNIAIFGIKPHRPETGYGYIKKGAPSDIPNACLVDHFVEKPSFDTAKFYVQTKEYLWNSGMFVFRASTILDEYKALAPEILDHIKSYDRIPALPFDKAILEKSSKLNVIPCDPLWSDIGSWQSLWEILKKDSNGNNLRGDITVHDSTNCLIRGSGKKIAVAGMDHAVIIETPDTIFIADKRNTDAIRSLVNSLKADEPVFLPLPEETGT